jgi:hypothetical protein
MGMGCSSTIPFQLKTCRAHGLSCAVFFLGDVGHIIQHSLILAEGQINASMTCQPLKCHQGMHWLDFSAAADGRWQKKNGGCLVIVEHVWDPLAQTSVSPSCW